MTHKDIYTKFMIEYDKNNISSSYPSLTHYEIATLLDKAYLALIALKLTGNNMRKVPFEYDTKAIEDLRLLQTTTSINSTNQQYLASNEFAYDVPSNMLYYVSSRITLLNNVQSVDNADHTQESVQLLNHELAQQFKATTNNLPWMKNPVGYMEGDQIRVLFDSYKYNNNKGTANLILTYIKIPSKFVGDTDDTIFELNDTMAEELINLALVFATENVESPRLQTKISTLQFES